MARRYSVAFALALACAWAPAGAQQLQRLTVTAFTLGSDNPHPALEVPFNLVVRLRVRERVNALENLDLPMLSDLELLGDERRYASDASGTSYVEVVRVVAHHTGRIEIAPATLDAVDALDGRAKRYSTNALSITVGGAALGVPEPATGAGGAVLRFLLHLLLLAAGIVAIAVLVLAGIIVRARRPVATPAVTPPVAAQPPVVQRTIASVVRDAAGRLRADPTRRGALQARAVLRDYAGASEHETLADVLRRPLGRQAPMPSVLRALERAAFTFDDDVPSAISHALQTMEIS